MTKEMIPLDSFFSSTPVPYTRTLKEHNFIEFNGKIINGYIYKGNKCLTLDELAIHVEKSYDTVKKAFQRAKKSFPLKFDIDFTRIPKEKISLEKFKYGKDPYFLYRTSVVLTGAKMSGKINDKLMYSLVHYYFDSEERKRSYLNYQPKDVFLLPRMGNKHYSKNMDLVDSRGEQIIANILYELGVPYQTGVYFSEYSFNSDFVIKTEPQTIIEYWGMETTDYLLKRSWKEEKYKELGWTLISIEPHEVENIPKLRNRLRKLLVR